MAVRLGPRQLAPELMERVTRAEAVLVEGFFPGEGTISTGRPRWDGGRRDRVRLRRCFRWAALMLAVLGGVFGSLAVDAVGTWAVSGFDPGRAPTGLFLLGWLVTIAWFVRRWVQVRCWYRSGVGREAELARRAVPVPVPEGPVPVPRWVNRARVVVVACAGLLFAGMGAWGVDAQLDARTQTQPFADGVLTTGTVVEVHTADEPTYRAESRFTDRDGQVHIVMGLWGNQRSYVGDEVTVSYRPSDPADARDLTTNAAAWKLPLAVSSLAIVVGLFLMVVVLVKGRQRWNE